MYCGVIGSRNSQPTGRPRLEHLEQQAAGPAQALVDVARAVEVRVVDHALPAGGGARLLEVDAHGHAQLARELVRLLAQPARVVERGIHVVDAARADHDHEAVVLARRGSRRPPRARRAPPPPGRGRAAARRRPRRASQAARRVRSAGRGFPLAALPQGSSSRYSCWVLPSPGTTGVLERRRGRLAKSPGAIRAPGGDTNGAGLRVSSHASDHF